MSGERECRRVRMRSCDQIQGAIFFFSSRRRHTRSLRDWSSDVCSSDLDPHTGWPADHAVLFQGGKVTDLGTLPGGFESQANAINNRGQVSGFASNGTRDKYSFFKVFGGPGPCGPSGWGTQARSFVWRNGVMRDIGTLGGPDAIMTTQNAAGQITGQSWTSSTPNPATGIPTLDPFLWAGGHLRDLGTLGGTIGFANWLNNRG